MVAFHQPPSKQALVLSAGACFFEKANKMKSELAKARDKWLESEEGKRCCVGEAHGQYLRNRCELAFIAGWDACKQALKVEEQSNG